MQATWGRLRLHWSSRAQYIQHGGEWPLTVCEENGSFFFFFLIFCKRPSILNKACALRVYIHNNLCKFECLWEGTLPHETWLFLANSRKYAQITTHHAILDPNHDYTQKGEFFIILAYAHLRATSSPCTKFVSIGVTYFHF